MTNGIILSGLTLNDLLEKIGEVVENRLGKSVPQKQEIQSDYLSRKEVSKLLKITLPTLHDWTKQGILKSYKIGTRVLYKETEVKQTLERVPLFKNRKGGLQYAQN